MENVNLHKLLWYNSRTDIQAFGKILKRQWETNNVVGGVQAKTPGEVSISTLKGNCQVIWYGGNLQCRRREDTVHKILIEANY